MKIISINRSEFCGKILIEVIWKFKKRQRLNYILTDEDFTDEYINNYLKNIKL